MGGDDVNGRVLVLMDGLPVMTAGNNIFNWDTISLDTVERIEVVRGPASALYGSSAMGGVINIITRKPTEEGFKTTVGTKFGRYNTWQNKLYHTRLPSAPKTPRSWLSRSLLSGRAAPITKL